jgi:hypothetical protein
MDHHSESYSLVDGNSEREIKGEMERFELMFDRSDVEKLRGAETNH